MVARSTVRISLGTTSLGGASSQDLLERLHLTSRICHLTVSVARRKAQTHDTVILISLLLLLQTRLWSTGGLPYTTGTCDLSVSPSPILFSAYLRTSPCGTCRPCPRKRAESRLTRCTLHRESILLRSGWLLAERMYTLLVSKGHTTACLWTGGWI
jgi:hypothetical protein